MRGLVRCQARLIKTMRSRTVKTQRKHARFPIRPTPARSRDHLILRLVAIVPAVQSLTAVQEFKGSKVQGERDTAGSEGFASRNGPVKNPSAHCA